MLVVAFALAGCGMFGFGTMRDPNTEEPRYFQLQLPGIDGAEPVPMQVADVIAIATRADLDPRTPAVGGDLNTVVMPVPGRPNAVLVGWPGGCEERVDLAIDPTDQGPNFTLKLLLRPDGCPERLVPRRVIVTFEEPVVAADFNLDVVQ